MLFLFLNAGDEVFKNNNIIFSEQTNKTCTIAFKDILLEGLGTHPSISMSKELIKGANYKVDTAEWGYYPSPSLEYSFRNKDRNKVIARLDQPLWTGGKLDYAYDNAKAKKSEAEHTYNENQYKLIKNYLDTLQAYMQANRKIMVLEGNKKQFNFLLEMLNRMIKAGVSSKIDKELLYSRLSKVDSDLVIAKSKLNVARIQFEILTYRAIPCSIVYEHTKIFHSKIEIEELIEDILKFHPSLKIIDSKVDAAMSEVSISKSNLWPSVVLRGEYRSSGGLYNDGISPTDETLAYLSFTVAPGPGLSLLSKINEAKVNVLKTKYDKKIKEKELIDSLMNDYIMYITAESQVKISANNLITLEKIYESNRRLYLVQKKQWLDLVNALSDLNRAKILYSRQFLAREVLEYKISLQTGKINLDNGDILDDI